MPFPYVCQHCGHTFLSHTQSRFKSNKYCGKPCQYAARRGSQINYGYRRAWDGKKYQQEHRYVMEQHLGRALLPTEIVHHKDHNKLNNAIENLELLSSNAEHKALHRTFIRTPTHKECSKCRIIKPRTEFHLSNHKRTTDTHQYWCKECYRIWGKSHTKGKPLL